MDLGYESRKRAPNFTAWENKVLILLVKTFKHQLDSKKTDHATVQLKQKVWMEITKQFNDRLGGHPLRSAKVLKHRYDNIRKNYNKLRRLNQPPSHHMSEEGGDPFDAMFAVSAKMEEVDESTENIHIQVEEEEEEEEEEECEEEDKDELKKMLDLDGCGGRKEVSEDDNPIPSYHFLANPTSSLTPKEESVEDLQKRLLLEEHTLKMLQMKQKHKLEMDLIKEEHAEKLSRLRQEHDAKMKFLQMQRKATLLNNL